MKLFHRIVQSFAGDPKTLLYQWFCFNADVLIVFYCFYIYLHFFILFGQSTVNMRTPVSLLISLNPLNLHEEIFIKDGIHELV